MLSNLRLTVSENLLPLSVPDSPNLFVFSFSSLNFVTWLVTLVTVDNRLHRSIMTHWRRRQSGRHASSSGDSGPRQRVGSVSPGSGSPAIASRIKPLSVVLGAQKAACRSTLQGVRSWRRRETLLHCNSLRHRTQIEQRKFRQEADPYALRRKHFHCQRRTFPLRVCFSSQFHWHLSQQSPRHFFPQHHEASVWISTSVSSGTTMFREIDERMTQDLKVLSPSTMRPRWLSHLCNSIQYGLEGLSCSYLRISTGVDLDRL